MSTSDDFPTLFFAKQKQWADWLEANPDSNGVWLKFAKKDKGVESINYHLALEVALCYGWIDSAPQKLDDTYYLQKFTPRRPRSAWSVRNRKKVTELIEAGRMKPAGQKEIDLAKADGRWDAAYESSSNAEIPADFLAELEKRPKAKAFFETLNKSNRYSIYYQLHTAKKPETRQRRFDKIMDMLENEQKFH